jgi:uncharacterized protein
MLLRQLPAAIVILLIRTYQRILSPLLGPRCRFHPTCSQYCIQAIRSDGVVKGCWRGFRRICRCHPWNEGGYDPP